MIIDAQTANFLTALFLAGVMVFCIEMCRIYLERARKDGQVDTEDLDSGDGHLCCPRCHVCYPRATRPGDGRRCPTCGGDSLIYHRCIVHVYDGN